MVKKVVQVKMPILAFGTKSQGFSLLELMIVLVLAALLSGVVASSMSGGPVLHKTAQDLGNSLRHARNLAQIQHQSILWQLNIEQKTFWIKGMKGKKKHLDSRFTVKIHSAVSEQIQQNIAGIRFFPDGSSTGGIVDLMYNNQKYSINVEWISGRISLQ